jgi:DNA uptake protein ComE-like DNA-binding protein
MRKLLPARLLPSLALLFALAQAAAAQAPAPVDTRGALAALPDSQAVLFINARRIVNEMLPKVMPPAEYQKMLTDARKVGFDARGIEYAVVAVRLADPAPANGLPEFVVVIKGNFNADTLLALGRQVAGAKNVKTRSETYGSKTLEIIDLQDIGKPADGTAEGGDKPKSMPYPEVAVMALDSSTLVAGVPAYVKAAVDSSAGQGVLKASLVDLAAHDPQALWSLTAELPPSLVEYLHKTGLPANQQADEMISWVRQLSLAQGMDALNYTMSAAVLTDAPEHASAFSGLIRMGLLAAQTGLSQEAAKLTPKHKDYAKAQTALAALKTFVNRTEGNTLHLSVSVPQATVAQLVRQEMAKKPAPTTTARPTRRRGRARK